MNSPKKSLLAALATVSSMTLVSRILGFLRDAVIARVFGAGIATDAFFVAFRIPNLLRRLFAEGAFAQAFVPVLSEYRSQRGEADTRLLADRTASLLALALLLVSVLGMLLAPWIIWLTAPGFSGAKADLTTALLRVTFPYVLFISLVSFAGGILNTWSRFAIPAVTPSLLNVAMIVSAAFLAPYVDPPVMALAWGVFAGGILQLALQVPALMRIGMLPRLNLASSWSDPGVRRILLLMAPAALGVSVSQLSLIINTIFASFLQSGSVSWLYYADRLMEFPTGLLGVALGTVLLPSLSRYYASDNTAEYSRLLDWGLRLTLIFALPSSVALAILSVPLVTTLFHYGQFSANDVWMTRQALVAYSVGLTGLILVKVLAPGFYARQNIRTPVRIALFTLAMTQVLNALLVLPLKHAGLALSIGLAACLNALLLYRQLRGHGFFTPQPGWLKFSGKIALALAGMAGVIWFAMGPEQWWLDSAGGVRVAALAGLVALGGSVYFFMLWLLGFRVADFSRRVA